MSLRTNLANTATLGGILGLLAMSLFGVPLLIALDWSSWHTYAGLIVLSLAAG